MITTREMTNEDIDKWYDALPPDDRFNLPRGGGQIALCLIEDETEREHIIPHASILRVYFDEIGRLNIECMSVSYTFSTEQAKAFVADLLRPYFKIENDARI